MIFTKTIKVPASTMEATPLVVPWSLAKGLLYRFEIFFPPGPSGLVGVKLVSSSHNIYPVDDGEWFIGDNTTLSFNDELEFSTETKQLELVCYNSDVQYEHVIQARVGIITEDKLIKSHFGYADIDTLITQLSALVAVLQVTAQISGKYSTEAVDKL